MVTAAMTARHRPKARYTSLIATCSNARESFKNSNGIHRCTLSSMVTRRCRTGRTQVFRKVFTPASIDQFRDVIAHDQFIRQTRFLARIDHIGA